MSSGMASGVAVSCVGAMIGKTSFVAFGGTNCKLKLMSTAASETGDGTEIPGTGGYPTGGISKAVNTTFGAAAYSATPTPNASVTNSLDTFSATNMPAITTVSASIWDTAGTPVRWWWGDLQANVTTNSGDTLTFNTSSVTVQLNV